MTFWLINMNICHFSFFIIVLELKSGKNQYILKKND